VSSSHVRVGRKQVVMAHLPDTWKYNSYDRL